MTSWVLGGEAEAVSGEEAPGQGLGPGPSRAPRDAEAELAGRVLAHGK